MRKREKRARRPATSGIIHGSYPNTRNTKIRLRLEKELEEERKRAEQEELNRKNRIEKSQEILQKLGLNGSIWDSDSDYGEFFDLRIYDLVELLTDEKKLQNILRLVKLKEFW